MNRRPEGDVSELNKNGTTSCNTVQKASERVASTVNGKEKKVAGLNASRTFLYYTTRKTAWCQNVRSASAADRNAEGKARSVVTV